MALSKLTDIRKSLSVEIEDLKVNGITTFTGNGQGAGFWGHKSGTVAANASFTATYYSS